MIKKRVRLPIYMQYLISYAIVLLIPIFITSMFIYSSILDKVRTQSLTNNEQILKQVEEVVDTRFKEMISIAADLSRNPLVSLSQYRNYFYFFSMRHVMNYKMSNTFIDQVFLYDREGESFYSSESMYSLDMFHQLFAYPEWPDDQVRNEFNTVASPVIRKAEPLNGDRYITYLRPIPISSSKPRGTAVYLIREQTFRDLLKTVLLFQGNEAFIIDNKGTVITGVYGEEPLEPPLIAELLSAAKNNETLHETRYGEPVYASGVQSKTTGLTYIVLTPEQELLRDVNEIKQIALLSYVIILLLGSIAIYVFMRFNYNPIRRLLEAAERWNRQNEFNAPYVRQHLLLGLLQGRLTDKEEFNRQGGFVGLSMAQENYFVAVIQNESGLASDSVDRSFYRELEQKGHQVFDVHTEAGVTLIVSAEDNRLIPEAELAALQTNLTRSVNAPVTIGVGTVFSELSRVTHSYIEASTALDHKFIYGSGKVLFFADLDLKLTQQGWDVRTSVENLLVHMDRGAVEQAMKTVEMIASEIRERSNSLFQAKSSCIEVINTILKYLRQHYNSGSGKGSVPLPDIIAYANFNSIDRLLEETVKVCIMACETIQSVNRHPDRSGTDRIMEYVQQHFDDYNLSIQSMADDLSYSVSYISRIFKEETGSTIMDYVKEMRIAKAKELLKTTSMPVQDIVEAVGYKDVSSFIRKFKQKLQMTPQEFRNYYKGK